MTITKNQGPTTVELGDTTFEIRPFSDGTYTGLEIAQYQNGEMVATTIIEESLVRIYHGENDDPDHVIHFQKI